MFFILEKEKLGKSFSSTQDAIILELMENKSKANVPREDFSIMCLLLQSMQDIIIKYARYEIQVEEINMIWNTEVRSGIKKYILTCFKTFYFYFYFKSWKTSIREVLYGKSLSETFFSSIISSSSSSPSKYRSKAAHGSPPNVKSVFQYPSVRVTWPRAQALPLRLNVLMLYGNMKQLTKLHVSIFALVVWTDCSSEFICLKIC